MKNLSPTLKLTMAEYFETAVYNMYCITNRMVTTDRKSKDFLEFRLKVAGQLIGDKYHTLEKDKKLLYKRANTRTHEVHCQPEKYTYGLHNTYRYDSFHIPYQHNMNA